MSKLDDFDSSGRHTDVDAALGEAEDYTRSTETPAERRLRVIVQDEPIVEGISAEGFAAIDMGREALELIRTMPTSSMSASWWDKRRDLLARAGEES